MIQGIIIKGNCRDSVELCTYIIPAFKTFPNISTQLRQTELWIPQHFSETKKTKQKKPTKLVLLPSLLTNVSKQLYFNSIFDIFD